MSGAAGYRPIDPTANVLTPERRAMLIAMLSDGSLVCPNGIDKLWFDVFQQDPWWAAHEAVRMCAVACYKMGLRTPEIEHCVRLQRDFLIRSERLVIPPPNEAMAKERTEFLAHRGDPPRWIRRLLLKAVSRDAEWSTYTSSRVLATMTARTFVNPVHVHEAVRQVRDRLGAEGRGERKIWMPN